LIADDSVVYADRLGRYLRRRGWDAHVVHNGQAAWEKLRSESFDAVVIDKVMPGLSGDEILKKARLDTKLKFVFFMMLTAYANVQSAIDAVRQGACYISKIEDASQFASIEEALKAGVVQQKVRRLRRGLLAAFDRAKILREIKAVVTDIISPDEVNILFIGSDGRITEIVGQDPETPASSSHEFVRRIFNNEAFVFERTAKEVRGLDPLIADAKTLLAVPVLGRDLQIVGALDMESKNENAFGDHWIDTLESVASLIGHALPILEGFRLTVEKERYEQLRTVLAELRHSVATYAQNILLNSQLLAEQPGLSPALNSIIDPIRRNAEAVQGVIQDLREISTDLRLERRSFDLRGLLEECRQDFTPELSDIPLQIHGKTAKINGDITKLRYCFLCILQNAIDSIEEHARSGITTPDGGHHIDVTVEPDAHAVSVAVRDTGIGFAVSPDQLFRPLYTTKRRQGPIRPLAPRSRARDVERMLNRALDAVLGGPARFNALPSVHELVVQDRSLTVCPPLDAGKPVEIDLEPRPEPAERDSGRGIGLFSAQRILLEHGGDISASSEGIGKGARFTVRLPSVEE
jgi:signal transduction histidine kinase/ActR/RegA family two-component response regulator